MLRRRGASLTCYRHYCCLLSTNTGRRCYSSSVLESGTFRIAEIKQSNNAFLVLFLFPEVSNLAQVNAQAEDGQRHVLDTIGEDLGVQNVKLHFRLSIITI